MGNSIYWILIIVSVINASFSQLLLKKASLEHHDSFLAEYFNVKVIVGYIMMVISTILTILALTKLEYKNAPIIESLGYILILGLGHIFLKEKMTVRKVIGNLIILVGILVFYI